MYFVKPTLSVLTSLLIAFSLVTCTKMKELGQGAYTPSKITLLDNTVLEGSTTNITHYKFLFKDARTGKVSSIFNKDVKAVTKTYKDKTDEYELIKVTNDNGKGEHEVLAAYVVKGDISLLLNTAYVMNVRPYNYNYQTHRAPGSGVTYQTHQSMYLHEGKNKEYLYLKKKNEPAVLYKLPVRLGASKKQILQDFTKGFFADMPDLMNKIGDDGYTREDIKKIVEEYNAFKSMGGSK